MNVWAWIQSAGVWCLDYKIIFRGSPSLSLNHLKRQWEEELGVTISGMKWQAAIKLVHSTSICIRHGLLRFKVLHTVGYIYPRVSWPNSSSVQTPPASGAVETSPASVKCSGYVPNWSHFGQVSLIPYHICAIQLLILIHWPHHSPLYLLGV